MTKNPLVRYPTHPLHKALSSLANFPVGGSVQQTIAIVDAVYQQSPGIHVDAPSNIRAVLSKWLIGPLHPEDVSKGEKLKAMSRDFNSTAKLAGSLRISSPGIDLVQKSYFQEDGYEYSYPWKQVNLPLEIASTTLPRDRMVEVFLKLSGTENRTRHVRTSLRMYYLQRFEVLEGALRWLLYHQFPVHSEPQILWKMLGMARHRIESGVVDNECTHFIHGDLRNENIVVFESGEIVVIDFEQGYYGGDLAVDLWKSKILEPIDLMLVQKIARDTGLATYDALSRGLVNLMDRTYLLKIDLYLSALVLRSAMNWDFSVQPNPNGGEVRGIRFIEGALERLWAEFAHA